MQFINNFRGIAILMIVYTHAVWATQTSLSTIAVLDYLVGNGTIFFIFIAGYLFSQTTEQFDYPKYLKNKFLTVFLPYIILSLPASLIYVLHFKTTHQWIDMNWFFNNLNVVERYLFLLVTGAQLGPLWFIPMIAIFYISSPVYYFLKKSNLIFPIFFITLAIALMIGRPIGNSNPFHSFAFFLPVYLLGMIAFRFSRQLMALQPYAGIAAAVYAVFIVALYVLFFQWPHEASDPIELAIYVPFVLISAVFCRRYLNHSIPILNMFGRLSFYLFFVHGYFAGIALQATRILFGAPGGHGPLVEIAIITLVFVLILFLCLALYVVLKFLLKDRSRYVIGG